MNKINRNRYRYYLLYYISYYVNNKANNRDQNEKIRQGNLKASGTPTTCYLPAYAPTATDSRQNKRITRSTQ